MSRRCSILLAAVVAVAGCSSDDGGQGPDETPDGDVLVANDRFEPSELEVVPGATVVWAWSSEGRTHNVTFDDGEQSGDRSSGTFQRTFAEPGNYPYHCTIHGTPTSGMRGVVTVAEAPGDDGPDDGSGDGPGEGPGDY